MRVPRLVLIKHTARDRRLRSAISATFVATLILDAATAAHVALLGNLIWLWVDFEDPAAAAVVSHL